MLGSKTRRRKGLGNYRLVRYADDWVVFVAGTRAHAEALREEAAAVLATMGLRLSMEKTRIAHIDEGFDFLGRHIQRHRKRGTKQQHVYTYPSKRALESIKEKVRTATQRTTTNQSLADLCVRLTPRCGDGPRTSGTTCPRRRSATCRPSPGGASLLAWPEAPGDVMGGAATALSPGWWPRRARASFQPGRGPVTRYRYRGERIPSPWAIRETEAASRAGTDRWRARCGGSRTSGSGERARETVPRKGGNAPRLDSHRVAGEQDRQDGNLSAVADRLADDRPDHQARRRRAPGRAGPAERSVRDLSRRGRVAQGSSLPDADRRPRSRVRGVGL